MRVSGVHGCTAAAAEVPVHDVRHSYATAALLAGVPPKVISERLGHATAAFTLQTYTHVIPGMDEKAANSVAALILGGEARTDGAVRFPYAPNRKPRQKELAWDKVPGQRW